MQPCLEPWLQEGDETRGVFERRQLNAQPTGRFDHSRQGSLEILRWCHARIMGQQR
jgi:hypothetical protein